MRESPVASTLRSMPPLEPSSVTNAAPASIKNARLANGRRVDIQVTDGRISAVSDASEPTLSGNPGVDAGVGVDVGGWLLLPAPAEPHAHLDKALTAEMIPNPKGDMMGAIEAWIAAAAAGKVTHDGIVERASQGPN